MKLDPELQTGSPQMKLEQEGAREENAASEKAPAPAAQGDGNGKVPPSYYARMSFTSEDVENVKVLSEGVFVLDVNSLSRDPMVLKDEDGVYYVKIPFEQKKQKGDGKRD
jgi:predicted  nucleic acid-binding Zn-ribbon protein